MLSKKEKKVMSAIYQLASNKEALLITPTDVRSIVGVEVVKKQEVESIVNDLKGDGYFDLIYSDRHGETVYCISLTAKGRGFLRESKLVKRNLLFRLFVTVALAVVSFIVGLILRAVF